MDFVGCAICNNGISYIMPQTGHLQEQKRQMKKSIVLILVCICCFLQTSYAVKPLRYISKVTEDGILFHVSKMKMPIAVNSQASKPMNFDVTIISSIDSVTMTATLISKEPLHVDSVRILSSELVCHLPLEVYYIEKHGQSFYNRVALHISLHEYGKLYKAMTPYLVAFDDVKTFQYKKNKWDKERQKMLDFLSIVELNKKTL